MFVGGVWSLSASRPAAPLEGILKRGSRTNLAVLVRAFVAEETKNQVLASNLH